MAEGDTKPRRTRKKPENSGEKSGPELKPQGHGGALATGGFPGNKGGTGRPPNEVRALARDNGFRLQKLIEKRIDQLEKVPLANVPWNSVVQMSEHCNKYGLGERTEHLYPQGMPFVGELSTLSEEEIDARLASAPESREA